ncbi:hypothetical protein QBC46DRAFT_341815 [Diplogelasinospora grovesii]|uniref:Regulator of phospholipase D SRF1 n=1 Tax=Diplogelasinospora grovesii TaxID=303347 RepID=A0AAN6N6N8_9PEZI|nr:hypothetical protein QBC46DRAFT_341815 [Diplogelasinospora grovesii]
MTTSDSSPSDSNHTDLRSASARTSSTVGSTAGARLRAPRSLPSWIDSYEARYGTPTEDDLRALKQPPPRALPPQRNNAPGEPQRRVSKDGFVWSMDGLESQAKRGSGDKLRQMLGRKNGADRGRKWDHLRSAEPVIVPGYIPVNPNSQWRDFVQSSEYGHLPNEESEIVEPEMLDTLQPRFNYPVNVPRPLNGRNTRQGRTAALYKRAWNIILRHPLVPLLFRLTVLLTSIVALALSARIFELERAEENKNTSERAQALVAIVVDTLAIPYIGYMTKDEYTGKPLGLRPATQKISLVLMDLFFIIFKSASTTLAFEALVYHNSREGEVQQYSRALAAFQTVGLISWTLTFSVNVFRLVQKLGGGEEESALWGGHG